MAPSPDSDAQFKFLIACIKHSTAGKIDFVEVASECGIVSKGAAAKRYERLMKAHGIASSNNGGRAASPAPSGPSTPTTPAGSKSTPKSRSSTAKKRKLAARGDDLDDDVKTEVKTEVKQEVKQEAHNSDDADGSYMINPTGSPLDMTAAHAHVTTPVGTYGGGDGGGDDEEVLLVSEGRREYGGAAMAPVAFVQQMMLPPPPENFYGFVDHPAGDLHLPSPTAVSATSAPFLHDHDTDCSPQTTTCVEPATGHWLHHHNAAFF